VPFASRVGHALLVHGHYFLMANGWLRGGALDEQDIIAMQRGMLAKG
jgi:hypothetical protein